MTEEEQKEIPALKMLSHDTAVRSTEEFVLKRCEDENCLCGKVHCPFCNTDHYKPTQPARVRDHLNLMHFMHAVHYDGMMIVKCFRECTEGIPAGHYHCPHCEKQIGKRAAFSRHLQGHLEKIGKDISVVQSPDFKQPGKIVFDGNEIPLCTKVCEDALGKHYHCPLCTTKNFSELGPMMAHLWRCREEGRQAVESPVSTPRPKKPPKKPEKTPETPTGKKMHASIVKAMSDLPVQRCTSERCCDKRYHCPLCPKTKFKPGQAREVRDHFQVHWKGRVEYKDLKVLICFGNCKDKRSNRSSQHYHCPECGHIFHSKEIFEEHLKTCANNLAAQKTTPAPPTRGRGRPRKSDKMPTPAKDLPIEVEVDLQELQIQEEDPLEPEPTPPPRPRGRPPTSAAAASARQKAILRLAESSDDDMEAFDKVTAVISKKIIASLAATTSVEDVLDDVAKNTGITWSWSPGTVEPVYVMSGDLIALVKAKRLLKELKEEYEQQHIREMEEAAERQSNTTDLETEPQLHFEQYIPETTTPDVAEAPTEGPDNSTSTPNVAETEGTLQVIAETVLPVKEVQVEASAEPGMDEVGTGELQISNEEPVTNAFDSIQGQVILTEEILQNSVIIGEDANGIVSLPQVSVEEIPQPTVGDLQMSENFAESLIGASSNAMEEVTVSNQNQNVQLTDNIFQQDFENSETTIVKSELIEKSEVLKSEPKPETNVEGSKETEAIPDISSNLSMDIDEIPQTSETQAGAKLQDKIFEESAKEDDEKGEENDDIVMTDTEVKETADKTANNKDDETRTPDEKGDNDETITESEVETPKPKPKKRKAVVTPTPEKKYSTRGIRMNFSELASGKKQTHVDTSDEEQDSNVVTPSPRRASRGRGRPPGSGNRGRPPSSGKRGRGRPPKRGRGRPPKRARLDLEEDGVEEVEPEEVLTAEELDDSDKDPDFVMKEKFAEEEDDDEIDPSDDVRVKKQKPSPIPAAAHIASIPVIRFDGQKEKTQKENKEPVEETTLDTFLRSIKTEILDPDYTIEHTPKPRRGRGRGRGKRRDTFETFLMDEAFKQHPCLDCPFLAESFSALTDHMIEVHNNVDHMRCDICEKSFMRQKHMTHHLIMKHGPLSLSDGQVHQNDSDDNKCTLCGFESQEFSELTDHYMKDHHAFDVLRCDVCELVFKKARHRTTHLDNIHGPHNRKGTFVCELCGHTCDKQRSLNWHKSYAHNLSTKKNPDMLYCRKCDFETSEQNEMREHKRTHLEERKWCDICQKSFSATTDMKTHMQAVHLKSKLCSCNVCGKTFSHWRYLTAHMERHTGEKKHLCNVCGQRFSKPAILKEHIETHKVMSERNYKHICQYCDARYYSKDKFMDHLNKHTGAKPHICDICGKGFSFRSMLLKHKIYLHSTDRPFKCDCCDKAFKFKQILKNHMVLHTGESKYICQGCKKPFSCSATLKTHRPKCRGDLSWQKRKGGMAKAVAANAPQTTTLMVPKQEFQDLSTLQHVQLHAQQIQQVQVDSADLQQVQVAVSQPNLNQLVDTIVVEMGDGQRSIVDLNTLEAATQLTETDNVATGIYLCSVCNAMFETVNAAEEHIAVAHAPGKTEVEEPTEEKLELEEVMESEADANISNLISELETKVKAKIDTSLLVGLKTPQ